ncbi:MAG: hypothetical protein SOW51_04005 [Oscillospiraceae bacterium]|nr:hypothetical protein [Oscillospiraceae bacterium]
MSNMNSNRYNDDVLDLHVLLRDVLKIFKRAWWICVSAFVAVSVIFCAYQKYTYVPTYESKASFTVNTTTSYAEIAASYGFYYDSANAEQMAKVLPYILKSSVFNEILKEELGEERINGTISLNAIKNSNLFSISVVSQNPNDAKAILDAVVKRLPDVSRYVIGETKLNIVQPSSVPTQPNNRVSYLKSVIICFAITFVASLLIIIIFALFRKTIQTEQDFNDKLNMNCMGIIPYIKVDKKRGSHPIYADESTENGKKYSESMKALSLKVVRSMQKTDTKVLMVTAALANEGKSSVAINLARYIKAGNPNKKVALVDLDLRKLSVSRELENKKNYCSLSKLLGETRTVKKRFIDNKVLRVQSESCDKKIKRLFNENPNDFVAFGSDAPSKSPEKKLNDEKMYDFMKELRAIADYVIIDSPPCAITTDPLLISEYSDGILFVIRQDSTHRWTILDCINNISARGCNIIGGVLNAAKESILDPGYSYGYYGYGRYGKYGKYGYRSYGGYGDGKYDYDEATEKK